MDRQPLYFTILIISILIGSSFYLSWSVDRGMGQVTVERLSIESSPGRSVEILVYSPRTGDQLETMPVLLTLHGLTGSKEGMYSFNVELARRNFTVVSVDLPGHGDSSEQFDITDFETMAQDAYAAVRHIQTTYPNVDNESYGVLSHSLGFRVAIELKDYPVAPMAYAAVGDVGKLSQDEYVDFPEKLLFAIGSFDEIVSRQDALQAIRTATGNESAIAGVTYRSLDNLTAYRLAFGPSNHVFEVVDSTLVYETVSWLVKEVQGEDQFLITRDPANQVYFSKNIASIAASFFLLISVIPVMWLVHSFLPEKLKPRRIPIDSEHHSVRKTFEISSILGASVVIIFVVSSLIGLSVEDFGTPWLNMMSGSGFVLFLVMIPIILLIMMFLFAGENSNNKMLESMGVRGVCPRDLIIDVLRNFIIAVVGIAWLLLWLGIAGASQTQPGILLVLIKWPVGVRWTNLIIVAVLAIPFILVEAAWIRRMLPSISPAVGTADIQYSWSSGYLKSISTILTLILKFTVIALLTVIVIFGTTAAGVSGGEIVLIGVIWVRILIIQVLAAVITAWTSLEFENTWSAVIMSAFILSLVLVTTVPII